MNRTDRIRDMLEPLENFERLHAATVRRFGASVVDLSYPNPRVPLDDRPYRTLAEVAGRVGVEDLRYSPFGGFTTARRRVATALALRHGLPYNYRDVILTPGATAAINLVLGELFTPPARVLVIAPCWMDYPLYLATHRLDYAFVLTDDDKHLDLAAIERAWNPHTRGLIISQPASPTGVCYSGEEVTALAGLLDRMTTTRTGPPLVLNDETHCDQIWSGRPVRSLAEDYPHTVTVHSFGKAWQMQGQRIGYAAVHPHLAHRHAARELLVAGMRTTGYYAPAALTQHLLTALVPFTPRLDPLAALQRRARDRLRRSGHRVIDADATRFVYVQVPDGDDLDYVRLAADRGVLVMPSGIFHEPGHFRLALNTDGPTLDRALDVLADLPVRRAEHHA
jgi:aspartate aminotransferase